MNNCKIQLKFSAKINWNMQNSMVVFTFSVLDGKGFFGQIRPKTSKLSVSDEI